MYQADQAMTKQAYAAQGQIAGDNAVPQTMSDSILSRLNNIRMNLSEACQSANHAADKIVGSAPTPIPTNPAVGIKAERIATCFLDSLQQVIAEIENIGLDTQNHLNRIHRQF